MNKKIGIALFSLVVLVLLVLLLFGGGASSDKEEVYSNWSIQRYDFRSKEPKGLAILKGMIQKHTKDSVFILDSYNQLSQIKNRKTATYLFIGDDFYLPDDQFNAIKRHIDSGANMLVSYERANANFYNRYFDIGGYSMDYSDKFFQWVGDTSLPYCSVYQNDTIFDDWSIFNRKQILDTNYRAYMFAVNEPTAFYVKQGKGKIHIHANPKLFHNYQVLSPNGYAHAVAWMKWIPKHQDVIIMKFAVPPAPPQDFGDADNDLIEDTSLLQFIIQNDALRTAFLFALGLIALFLIFRTKRRQNILGGVDQHRNMSVVFVETLSSIYIAKNSPVSVLQVMRRNFYAQINRHFYIDLTKKDKFEENVKRLIEKSGYPADKLNDIIKSIGPRGGGADNAALGVLYRKIDEFYKATGIRKEYDKVFIQGRGIEIFLSPLVGGASVVIALLLMFKGMQLMKYSDGYGIGLAILSGFLAFFSVRLILIPRIQLNDTKLVKNSYFIGKKTILLNQAVSTTVTGDKVEFRSENNEVITVSQQYMGKRSRSNLSQIVAYLKRKAL